MEDKIYKKCDLTSQREVRSESYNQVPGKLSYNYVLVLFCFCFRLLLNLTTLFRNSNNHLTQFPHFMPGKL